MNEDLITRLQTEADQCRNDGADDIARLLDEAARALHPQPKGAPGRWCDQRDTPTDCHQEACANWCQLLATAPAPDDKVLTQVLEERDAASDYIDALLDEVLGKDRHEWTSNYGHADAMDEVRERMAALQAPAVKAEPAAPTYLSDAWLYRYAQEAAFALQSHSYAPKTAEEAKYWMPHWWVCEAIQSAWLDGQAGRPKARCPQLGDAPEIKPPVQPLGGA